jgi:hypothetical protein
VTIKLSCCCIVFQLTRKTSTLEFLFEFIHIISLSALLSKDKLLDTHL